LTFIGAGVALIAGANRQDPAQGKCSKTGDFDVNGEEPGSEVFRSPFLPRSARPAMQQPFSLRCGIERQAN